MTLVEAGKITLTTCDGFEMMRLFYTRPLPNRALSMDRYCRFRSVTSTSYWLPLTKQPLKEDPVMKIHKIVRDFTCLLVLAICLGAAAMAQSPNKIESVATVTADQAEVRWQPQVEYGRLILSVSTPDGEVIRQEFEAGTAPSFKLIDKKGFNLPD